MAQCAMTPVPSMTQSSVENATERATFERLYLSSRLAGTDPLSVCAREPIYVSAGGGGTMTFAPHVAIVASGRHLEFPDVWCARVPAGTAVHVFLIGGSRCTSAETAQLSIQDDEIGSLLSRFLFLRSGDSIEPSGSHGGLVASILDSSSSPGVGRDHQKAPLESSSSRISKELIETLGMSAGEISSMLNISERGYRNWLAGARMRLPNEKRILWLRHLSKLVESGRGRGNVREWFMTPVDGVSAPFDLIKRGKLSEVAKIASAQFERAVKPHALDSATARRMGFPFDMLEGDDDDLRDLGTVLNKQR